MQVGNINAEKISASKRKGRVSGSSGFIVSEHEEDLESETVSQTKVNVSSLWQLQAFDDWSVDVDNMKEKAGRILEGLKNLRMCLLKEEIGKEDIESLAKALENTDIDLKFPELQGILDDVRLRAAVELAKISREN
jgi:hypothetical protein